MTDLPGIEFSVYKSRRNMARERKGFIVVRDGRLYARITYTDSLGKRHDLMRRAETRTEAKNILRKLLRQFEDRGEQSIEGDRMRFKDLAHFYKERRLKPAEYHGGRKFAGLRSYETPLGYLEVLVEYFGKRRIKGITHSDVEEFKKLRLQAPTPHGKERAIASVNRELELFRAVLRFAVRQGWLLRSPFETGSPLISKADEVRRERILTQEEEQRLLSVCIGRRAHLRGLLIAALDSACRRGELFKLQWSDIDFENRVINVRATTTKTMRERTIGMTERLAFELKGLYERSLKDPNGLVFNITTTVKIAFASACKEVGIKEFRVHDCRHTAITRMIQSGMPASLVMKVSGHTQPITFARYINVDGEAARQGAAALDVFNERQTETGVELVN
jgi:integrase